MIAVQAGSILSATAPLQSSRSPARAELCVQHSARTIDAASSRKQTDDIIISPFEIEEYWGRPIHRGPRPVADGGVYRILATAARILPHPSRVSMTRLRMCAR